MEAYIVMISQHMMKIGSEGFDKERHAYYPRPSGAGTERCIRAQVYHALDILETNGMGDRYALTIQDSIWHEDLSRDLINRSAMFRLHSDQMALDCIELDFVKKPNNNTDIADENRVKDIRVHSIWLHKQGWKWCKICNKAVPLNMLHGHIDGVITDLAGIDRLWEHKAINFYAFDRYWSGDNEWPIDYFTQCCLYIRGLQKVNPKVNEALLQMKNKNTAQYIDYHLRYDAETDTLEVLEIEHSNGDVRAGVGGFALHTVPNILANALERFRQIDAYRLERKLPRRPYGLDTYYPCGWCGWKDMCAENYIEEAKKRTAASKPLTETLKPDVIEDIQEYYRVTTQYNQADKRRKQLKELIIDALNEESINRGEVNEYLVNIGTQTRTYIDKDKLTPEDRAKASYTSTFETLRVTKPNKETDK